MQPTSAPAAASATEAAPESAAPVGAITTLVDNGGRLDWSHANGLIVFDRMNSDGGIDIWTVNGEGQSETCLTCNQPDAPGLFRGNPAWHPSGDYIVFQAAEEADNALSAALASPGIGRGNNLWLMTADGSTYFQLTQIEGDLSVLHPHFSHDGSRLLWAEQIGKRRPLQGTEAEWVLNVADFALDENGPRLGNVQRFQPLGPVFYESHGFSPDDSKILFSAFFEPNEEAGSWFDIYTLDLASSEVARLTESMDAWDEHAHYSPDGQHIAWISSTDCDCDPSRLRTLRTDLWLMRADGSNKVRLTHFSNQEFPEFNNDNAVAIDNAWSPDGRRIAIYVIDGSRPTRAEIALVEVAVHE